jgi:geranylgeranyl pyrophosphate synthase
VLTKIMGYVGISFQIKDDLLNITNTMGKNIIAEDFY